MVSRLPYPTERAQRDPEVEWFLDMFERLDWTFAKTMPTAPHSYVVSDPKQPGRGVDRETFERMVRVIRKHGEPGKFHSSTNIYLTIGERRWWTMGSPMEETIIINTATTERTYGTQNAAATASEHGSIYDDLATVYDDRYRTPACEEENRAARDLIVRHFGAYAPRTLDVGCGTGLLLDLGVTAASIYTGVDPSQGMLNELVRKHPRARDLLPTRAEDVDWSDLGDYDLVASLFASPSYIEVPTLVESVRHASSLWVGMAYVHGYAPDYYDGSDPMHTAPTASAEATLRGFDQIAFLWPDHDRLRIGAYDTLVVRTGGF